jgi:2-polyprenyl-6-methoxyphenol hydroxylase-like FAD-dependent oxidoreductase
MNVGFGDAGLLSTLIPELLSGKKAAERVVSQYTQLRRPAAVSAARRAAVSMLLGTGRGRAFSHFRRELLSRATRSERGNDWIARHFAMLTLPGTPPTTHARHQDSFA